jgi:hypothetical protein
MVSRRPARKEDPRCALIPANMLIAFDSRAFAARPDLEWSINAQAARAGRGVPAIAWIEL